MMLTYLEHHQNNSKGAEIIYSNKTFNATLKITKFLLMHNRIILSQLKYEEVEILPQLMKEFYKQLPYEFSTNQAVEISKKNGISERKLYRILTNKKLFEKLGRGRYRKVQLDEKHKDKK